MPVIETDAKEVPTMICLACARLRRSEIGDRVLTCEAFPDGIPDEIRNENFDHRQPFPGDNGVRFALQDGRQETLDWWEKYRAGELPFQKLAARLKARNTGA